MDYLSRFGFLDQSKTHLFDISKKKQKNFVMKFREIYIKHD